MNNMGIEEMIIADFLRRTQDETVLENWLQNESEISPIIVVQGFEKRSYGILEKLAEKKISTPLCIIAKYPKKDKNDPNHKYSDIFKKYSNEISHGAFTTLEMDIEGKWIENAIKSIDAKNVILDITGLSNRMLFLLFDRVENLECDFFIVYTEAGEYWPKLSDWQKIEEELSQSDPNLLADIIDNQPWLYSNENFVSMIEGHEGYDTAGYKRALLGFLTFKCARLASILLQDNFSYYHFIVGKPRKEENLWRANAQERINHPIINSWPKTPLSTFGFRNTVRVLADILLIQENPLLKSFNVSLALLGSKLQTVGCWAISRICNSIAVVTSTPNIYYADAFSEGIGQSWIFPFQRPLY